MTRKSLKPWVTNHSHTVFDAAPYLTVRVETVTLPDARVIDDFYQVDLRPFALIVAEMADGTFLMLRQYKHGPKRVSLTFPAGFVEDAEHPQKAAERELLEETGCKASFWEDMGTYRDNGNQGGCQGTFFLARGCQRVQPANAGDLEEMEEVFVTAEDLDHALKAGGFAITHHVAAWGLARLYL